MPDEGLVRVLQRLSEFKCSRYSENPDSASVLDIVQSAVIDSGYKDGIQALLELRRAQLEKLNSQRKHPNLPSGWMTMDEIESRLSLHAHQIRYSMKKAGSEAFAFRKSKKDGRVVEYLITQENAGFLVHEDGDGEQLSSEILRVHSSLEILARASGSYDTHQDVPSQQALPIVQTPGVIKPVEVKPVYAEPAIIPPRFREPEKPKPVCAPKPKKRERLRYTLQTGSKPVEIYHDDLYDLRQVGALLRKAHGSFASNQGLVSDAFVSMNPSDGKVTGEKLAEYLTAIDGMLCLSSTSVQKNLERDFNVTSADLDSFLKGEGSKYVHTAQGVLGKFVKRGDLQRLSLELDKSGLIYREPARAINHTDALTSEQATSQDSAQIDREQDRIVALHHWEDELRSRRILPFGATYDLLLRTGVLDNLNRERIESTYARFEKSMEGKQFFNVGKLREQLGKDGRSLPWPEFKNVMQQLTERGLITNLGNDETCVYAVANGKLDEVYRVLNIKR